LELPRTFLVIEPGDGDVVESTHATCAHCLQHPVRVEARQFGVTLSCPACGWEEAYQRV
jgi:Cft2 family RNA processing exonuclease